ncbi:MAG: hypothetical protein OXQ84_13280 [bacterium]|nr:hypothetical protein [bacterium]
MTGPRKAERVTMHSVSCTRLEWERIRECARREGLSISRYVVERALARNPSAAVRNPPRLHLTPDEQRAMVETVAALAERTGALDGTDEVPGFAVAARVLFEMKMDEMSRAGRHGTMTRLLDSVLQDSRAARLSEEVYRRTR